MSNTMTLGPFISKSVVSPTTQTPNQRRSSFSPKGQHGNTKRFSGKGSSRYAKKKQGKRSVKPAVALRGPVLEYISSCCSLPARKPRTGSDRVQQGRQQVFGEQKEKKQSEKNGLGGWRCSGCGKQAKVRPQKPTPKSVEVPSANVSV